MNAKTISFGDTVRVRATGATKEAGHADLVGTVRGETTPSSTGVDVIGELEADYAINVYFEDKGAGVWFEPRFLQFVDHTAGLEIGLDGVAKKWVRSEDGEWIEHSAGAESGKDQPWWKIWSGRIDVRFGSI